MSNSPELQGETFPQLLLQRLKHDAERPAMREKAYGIWQTWTLGQLCQESFALSAGLADLGFARNDTLVIAMFMTAFTFAIPEVNARFCY